jgi:hypothetical protein
MAAGAANRYPEPALVLRPSKVKWAGVAALSLIFTIGGGAMLAVNGGRLPWAVLPWLIALPAVGFFGFGFLVALAALFSPGNRLEIDEEGFSLYSFGRRRRIAWRDTLGVSSGAGGMVCTVAVDVPVVRLVELPYGYGRSAADLTSIMNQLRARADAREGFDAIRELRNKDAEFWGFL